MTDVVVRGTRKGSDIGTLHVEVEPGLTQEREQYEVLRELHARHFDDEEWSWALVEPDANGEPNKVFMARAVAEEAGFDNLLYARPHDGGTQLVRVVESH